MDGYIESGLLWSSPTTTTNTTTTAMISAI